MWRKMVQVVSTHFISWVAIKPYSPIHMYSVFYTHYTPSHIVHLINYNLNIYCISLDIIRKYIFNCSLHTLSDKFMYKPKKTIKTSSKFSTLKFSSYFQGMLYYALNRNRIMQAPILYVFHKNVIISV